MTPVLYALAAVGSVTVARWMHELWRTRKDKPAPWFWWRQQ